MVEVSPDYAQSFFRWNSLRFEQAIGYMPGDIGKENSPDHRFLVTEVLKTH